MNKKDIFKRDDEIAKEYFEEECGYLHINFMIRKYWELQIKNFFIPKSNTIYDALVKNNADESNPISWGDADGRLFYIKNKNNIFVFTSQTQNYIFIFNKNEYHIRKFYDILNEENYLFDSLEEIKEKSIQDIINNLRDFSYFADDGAKNPEKPSLDYFKKSKFKLKNKFFVDPGYVVSYEIPYEKMFDLSSVLNSFEDLEYLLKCNIDVMLQAISNLGELK